MLGDCVSCSDQWRAYEEGENTVLVGNAVIFLCIFFLSDAQNDVDIQLTPFAGRHEV